MSQFFISCKESKIENNRSFYGCFHIGPLEPSQSITIANALRRTLLSELYGFSIISVEIEGASHEYSSLMGVKDSVLDILLNLKEIVLRKSINPISFQDRKNIDPLEYEYGMKPQIGYLKVRGPGLVRASNLRLPCFIQCVDPDQYIATLAQDGFLNMKFVIQYGNKWADFDTPIFNKIKNEKKNLKKEITLISGIEKEINEKTLYNPHPSPFNLHLKKRRLILKKLRRIGLKFSNPYINILYQNPKQLTFAMEPFNELYKKNSLSTLSKSQKYPSINLNKKISDYSASGLMQVPGCSVPSIQVPSAQGFIYPNRSAHPIINHVQVATSQTISQNLIRRKKMYPNKIREKLNLSKILNNFGRSSYYSDRNKQAYIQKAIVVPKKILNYNSNKSFFLNSNPLTIDGIFNPITKVNYIIQVNDFKTSQTYFENSEETLELFETLNVNWGPRGEAYAPPRPKGSGGEASPRGIYIQSSKIKDNNIVEESNQSNILKNKTESKTTRILNQTLLSPALKISLENILKIKHEIINLKKEIPKHNIIFEVWTNGSIHPRDAIYEGLKNLVKLFSKLNKINSFQINPLYKSNLLYLNQIEPPFASEAVQSTLEVKTITTIPNISPLNETSFLSTYIAPKVRDSSLINSLSKINIDTSKVGLNGLDRSSFEYSQDSAPLLLPPTPTVGGGSYLVQHRQGFKTSAATRVVATENFSRRGGRSLSGVGTCMVGSSWSGVEGGSKLNCEYKPNQSIKNKTLINATSNDSKSSLRKKNIKNLDLGILSLSLRSYTCLRRLNINTINELIIFLRNNSLTNLSSTWSKTINSQKIISKFSLQEIEYSLQKLGIYP